MVPAQPDFTPIRLSFFIDACQKSIPMEHTVTPIFVVHRAYET
jgi:hypothetical protein